MVVTLKEAKQYLRVDSSDEDESIGQFMRTAEHLILDVSRRPAEELEAYGDIVRTAELYAIAYLYEHREEADHRAMTETIKYLLFSVRKEAF
ncbi:MAG: head-tail connector protein [Lachnospiraceae bacterium]